MTGPVPPTDPPEGDESEWTPMSDERRAELIEELIALFKDPDGLDWEYLRSLEGDA